MLKIRQEQMAALEAHMADRFRQKLLKQLRCELMDESLKQKLDPPGTVPADSSPHGTDPLGEAPPPEAGASQGCWWNFTGAYGARRWPQPIREPTTL